MYTVVVVRLWMFSYAKMQVKQLGYYYAKVYEYTVKVDKLM